MDTRAASPEADVEPGADAGTEPDATSRAEVIGLAVGGAMVLAVIAQLVMRESSWKVGLALSITALTIYGVLARYAMRRGQPGEYGRLAGSTEPAIAGSVTWPRKSVPFFGAAVFLALVLFWRVDVMHLTTTVWAIQYLAVVTVILAGLIADWGLVRPGPLPRLPLEVHPWIARVCLAAIVLAGAWLRFRDLEGLPFGFWFDEADVALMARRMTEDATFRPVFVDVMPGYHAYIIAILFEVFGESIAAVRGVSAAFGVGTILAGYLVGRELFGRTAGLTLASLVAFSRWSLTLSRIGMHNVTVPFFSLLALGLLLRGYRRKSTLDFVFAGLAVGGGMIFYSAMASAILAIGVFALVVAVKDPHGWRSVVPRLGAAFLASVIIFIPLGKFALTEGEVYFARNRTTALWSDSSNLADGEEFEAFKDNIVSYGAMLHYKGDPNGRHNLPNEPMLPPVVAGLSILGIGAAIFRMAKRFGAIVLIWSPLALAPGILSLPWEAPNSLRAVAAQPVAMLLATGALAAVLPVMAASKRLLWGFGAVVLLGLGITAYADSNRYFNEQAEDFAVWAQHSTKETMAAQLIAESPPETHVLGVAFLRGQKSIDFIAGRRPVDGHFGTDSQLPVKLPEGKDALLLAVPESYDVAAQASRMYPNASVVTWPPDRNTELIIIRIPEADIAESRGWTSQETGGQRATLLIDQPGFYQFRVRDDAWTELRVDGYGLSPCPDEDGEPPVGVGLAAGAHTIEIDQSASGPIEWLPPATADWAPIPAVNLLQARFIEGGLLGTRYVDPQNHDGMKQMKVDATIDLRFHELPFDRPYEVEWTGALRVPETGQYVFFVDTDDASTLWINGAEVLSVDEAGGVASGAFGLEAGEAEIKLTYLDVDGASRIQLEWVLDSGDQEIGPEIIPASSLIPRPASSEQLDCPGFPS